MSPKVSPAESISLLFEQERHGLRPWRWLDSTAVLLVGPERDISISAYVLNGSRGCTFNEWWESAATNWNSVDHETERETLSFLLLINSLRKIANRYRSLSKVWLLSYALSGKRMTIKSSSATFPFSSNNSGWIVRRPVRSLDFVRGS